MALDLAGLDRIALNEAADTAQTELKVRKNRLTGQCKHYRVLVSLH
jgi:hypothetical protein